MKSRAWVSAAGIMVLCVSVFADTAQAAKYKIRWFVGHQNPDYFEIAAKDFKKEVEARTKGDIQVDIMTAVNDEAHNGSTAEPQIAQAVEKGEAEMGHSFTDVVGGMFPKLHSFEAPYLFRSNQHMEGVLDGPIGDELLEGFRSHKMVGLSFTYSGGPSSVASVDREIRRPEDLKGLKVGVYGDAVNAAWLKQVGATPVAFHHDLASLNRLAKDGTIDAAIITWQNFSRATLHQKFKYMNMPGSTYLVSVTYINEKFFNSLPAEYQTIVKEVSRSAGRIERTKTIELNENARRAMIGRGVRPIVVTEDGKRAFAKALKPAYEGTIDALIGKDFMERIKSAGDGAVAPIQVVGK